MIELPMPSDVKKAAPAASGDASSDAPAEVRSDATATVEPPSLKLVVRLFVIPLVIVAAAVGIVTLISMMAGAPPTFDQALSGLKEPGGRRTGGVLVGPASKQRYMYAKALADGMKDKMQAGMGEADRTKLADDLLGIVDTAKADEGDVKHFLLLALGRVWEVDPRQPPMDSPAAAESRKRVVAKLLELAQPSAVTAPTEGERHQAQEEQSRVRKAAVLALAFMSGRPETREAMPKLVALLDDPKEDLDVRMAAAAALGKVAKPDDADAVAALRRAMNASGDENVELVWQSAVSLAELNQPEAAGTVMMLLSRKDLGQLQYVDRETDWKNPVRRPLNELEQERILINTVQGAVHLDVPEVQQQIRKVADSDPSVRVREAAKRELAGKK
jgi:hypothetical protein